MVANIEMTGPSFFHLECVSVLIKEISKTTGIPPHEVLADIARLL